MFGKHVNRDSIKFGGPANYRITVKGPLSTNTIDCLHGMKVSKNDGNNVEDVSQLHGTLSDQAALSGLLNTLYEAHLTIVSVELLKEDYVAGCE